MNKSEFLEEVNRVIKNGPIVDMDLDYSYKDTSDVPELVGNTVAASYRDTGRVTITCNGKTKSYEAGDGTTFPVEFITDFDLGFFKKCI